MGDKRNDADLKAYIRTRVTGHLVDEKYLDDAIEMLFKKSAGNFLYMASIAANFEGDKKWTIAELKALPDGLDGFYCENFARILKPKLGALPHDADKVSKWCSSVMT